MSLANFQSAVKAAAAKYAPTYGLSPDELEYALLADAHLEGGHGETAATGDGGASVGRFQYNTAGGHGSTLLNQGYSKDQIATDEFQANDWAPILAQQLADVKSQGLTGGDAIAKAIFQAERPATMYAPQRVAAALDAAGALTGQTKQYSYSHPGAPATGDTGSAGGGGASAASGQADKAVELWRQMVGQQPDPNKDPLGWAAWKETVAQLGDIAKVLQTQEGKRDTAFDQDLSSFNAKVSATHYANADALANSDSDLTRSKYGLDVGTTRAGQQLEAAKLLAQWGTAPGKSSYSPNDLGSSYADTYRRYGMDPARASLNYTGTNHIDPARDASQWDNMLGVGGPLPHPPSLIAGPGAGDVPSRPSFADGAGGAAVAPSVAGLNPLDIMGSLDKAFPGWRDGSTTTGGTGGPPSARDDWANPQQPTPPPSSRDDWANPRPGVPAGGNPMGYGAIANNGAGSYQDANGQWHLSADQPQRPGFLDLAGAGAAAAPSRAALDRIQWR